MPTYVRGAWRQNAAERAAVRFSRRKERGVFLLVRIFFFFFFFLRRNESIDNFRRRKFFNDYKIQYSIFSYSLFQLFVAIIF